MTDYQKTIGAVYGPYRYCYAPTPYGRVMCWLETLHGYCVGTPITLPDIEAAKKWVDQNKP